MYTDTELLGEAVTIYARGSLALHRDANNQATYVMAPEGSLRSSVPEPGVWVLEFGGLVLNMEDEPEEGPTPSDFYDPLGGRPDALRLQGTLAWRCEQPDSPSSTPYAAPTPDCPAPATAPKPPAVTASVAGSAEAEGVLGSFTLTTCSTALSEDRVETNPKVRLKARAGQPITISAPDGWQIVAWEGFDTALAGEGANVWNPVDLGGGSRTFVVPGIGREGDSVLTLDLTMMTDDRRVVGSLVYTFLIRVRPA